MQTHEKESSEMFLSLDEIATLTGYKSRICQRRWCMQNGICFLCRPDGSLVISRQHVEERLGASSDAAREPLIEPDFESLI